MIRVEQIVIKEFRGIRDLTINFKGENFAVCGPNGTGKSGVVDALEFALTGNISRLSGKGTGEVSVKDHAPHVDSRNRPDKAKVILTISIPNQSKTFTVTRTVKEPLTPTVVPDEPAIHEVLRRVASHPEFALSRRELIRYVISAPGDRAKEVQALLQLDQVENLRTTLQKIANAYQRDINPLKREREETQEQLLRAIEISDLSPEKLLAAVNVRRALLGLGPIAVLTASTSLRDGIVAAGTDTVRPTRVPKSQAVADLKNLSELIGRLASTETISLCQTLLEEVTKLNADPLVADSVTRERFLESALAFIDDEKCPVCDTPWNLVELKAIVTNKLRHFEEITKKREGLQQQSEPLLVLVTELRSALASVERYGALLTPVVNVRPIQEFKSSIASRAKMIEDFLPLAATITALGKYSEVPANASETIAALETAIAAIPEPTEQDAARDYLTVCQERLEAYRRISLRHKQAEERYAVTKKIYDTYATVSTSVLEGIYKKVEKDFSELYRFINRNDEGKFSALLTPSIGKLSFGVDFYGRGFFPPGAYHSEGHQDGMGICLYLALMRYLLGDSFTFAVLDDVLMSVDVAHRREVCELLKKEFPKTQFILTTHDQIWLRHMKSVGLISARAFIHFKNWNVDVGPTEWSNRDVWQEIDSALNKNDVHTAAGILRHYLEFISLEICHCLRAPVELRADAQFQLGDLLPAAIGRFRSLLKEGKASAQSWGKADELAAITSREAEFSKCVQESLVEQWQINPAIHYNNWADFQPADFKPVVQSFRSLTESFVCPAVECGGMLYVLPERGKREEVRCPCKATSINLIKKP